MFCSAIVHEFNNLAPRFVFFKDITDDGQVFFGAKLIFFFGVVNMVVPSLSARFWSFENTPLSFEKY
jgi:hypothetical protein